MFNKVTRMPLLYAFNEEINVSEQKKRILVMDDEDIVADIAKQMLEYMGYDVAIASTGEDAISMYREAQNSDPFSLVIMDMNIPGGMGGMEAVSHVLEIDEHARVLISTGYASDAIVNEYATHGFCGCIAKPFDMKGLQEAVVKAVQG